MEYFLLFLLEVPLSHLQTLFELHQIHLVP
nr:MAG TPA: hypothetical protein [Bacteriophage sp.]